MKRLLAKERTNAILQVPTIVSYINIVTTALTVLCQDLVGNGTLDKHPNSVEHNNKGDTDGGHDHIERPEYIFGVVKVGHDTWRRISIRVGACCIEHGFNRTAKTVMVSGRVLSSWQSTV
jgi:hypothetical protein